MKHNKNLNLLLNLRIDCISAKSALQILSIQVKCTFLLFKFLINSLCNSSANSLLEIFSFWHHFQRIFYQNIYKPLKQVHVDTHYILDL